ncbi:MAG: hypothetical protein QF449_16615 [Alphaproteobacteria bacterium]|jgi:hypothetical protein|nr:hypothetical protein [Alphaproteobacteria bacterium]MDP6590248.1 hypothetical protein [Alphaproteobacteria bacterium]MDP6819639.1 hypothetical protein [Alphaproteobacteria bacterium]|tara:strand:- start:3121 stop:3426 length:306 start_codon:yes stop_codon:yes gene_type:complete
MIVCRIVASLFLLAALGLFAYEIVGALGAGGYDLIAGGELWARLHANSLVGFQALIEKHISPWLWGEIILPILLAPAWAIATAPGLVLALACRGRRKRERG